MLVFTKMQLCFQKEIVLTCLPLMHFALVTIKQIESLTQSQHSDVLVKMILMNSHSLVLDSGEFRSAVRTC